MSLNPVNGNEADIFFQNVLNLAIYVVSSWVWYTCFIFDDDINFDLDSTFKALWLWYHQSDAAVIGNKNQGGAKLESHILDPAAH